MKKNISKIPIVVTAAIVVSIFFTFDLQRYLSFEYLKASRLTFQTYYMDYKFFTIAVYMLVYITVTALSLPGATVMTLAGGAFFGFRVGLLLVSFASTIGATIAFLVPAFY